MLFITVTLIGLRYVMSAGVKRRVRIVLLFAALWGVAALIFISLDRPVERIHLVEYAVLGIMVAWAMSAGEAVKPPYLMAGIAALLLGIVDECLQGFMPGRIYDSHDILLNGGGILCGLAVLALRESSRRHSGFSIAEREPAGCRGNGNNRVRVAEWYHVIPSLMCAALIGVNISLLEAGTPTLFIDVHRELGRGYVRDGLRHFGYPVILCNIAVILCIAAIMWRYRGRIGGRYAAVGICALVVPLVIVGGWVAGLPFR